MVVAVLDATGHSLSVRIGDPGAQPWELAAWRQLAVVCSDTGLRLEPPLRIHSARGFTIWAAAPAAGPVLYA